MSPDRLPLPAAPLAARLMGTLSVQEKESRDTRLREKGTGMLAKERMASRLFIFL